MHVSSSWFDLASHLTARDNGKIMWGKYCGFFSTCEIWFPESATISWPFCSQPTLFEDVWWHRSRKTDVFPPQSWPNKFEVQVKLSHTSEDAEVQTDVWPSSLSTQVKILDKGSREQELAHFCRPGKISDMPVSHSYTSSAQRTAFVAIYKMSQKYCSVGIYPHSGSSLIEPQLKIHLFG